MQIRFFIRLTTMLTLPLMMATGKRSKRTGTEKQGGLLPEACPFPLLVIDCLHCQRTTRRSFHKNCPLIPQQTVSAPRPERRVCCALDGGSAHPAAANRPCLPPARRSFPNGSGKRLTALSPIEVSALLKVCCLFISLLLPVIYGVDFVSTGPLCFIQRGVQIAITKRD